jgi:hypothetical protein
MSQKGRHGYARTAAPRAQAARQALRDEALPPKAAPPDPGARKARRAKRKAHRQNVRAGRR